MTGDIQPIVRTLIPEAFCDRLGIDALTIIPEDEDGNSVAIVIVDQKTNTQLFIRPRATTNILRLLRYLDICVRLDCFIKLLVILVFHLSMIQ